MLQVGLKYLLAQREKIHAQLNRPTCAWTHPLSLPVVCFDHAWIKTVANVCVSLTQTGSALLCQNTLSQPKRLVCVVTTFLVDTVPVRTQWQHRQPFPMPLTLCILSNSPFVKIELSSVESPQALGTSFLCLLYNAALWRLIVASTLVLIGPPPPAVL